MNKAIITTRPDTTPRPSLGPCLRALCGPLPEPMAAKLRGGGSSEYRIESVDARDRGFCLARTLFELGGDVHVVSTVLSVTMDPTEATELLETHGTVPLGWGSDPLRRWSSASPVIAGGRGRASGGTVDLVLVGGRGGASGAGCDVVLAGGRGEQATSAFAPSIADLVAVASLDWAHAEALGRACAEMLTSSAQTIVWRVCTEAEAAEGMEAWQYETLRSRARERGMTVAPCDELSCLGVLLVAVGASSITLATSPLGRAFSACEVWREQARARGANGDANGDAGASARGTTAVAAT